MLSLHLSPRAETPTQTPGSPYWAPFPAPTPLVPEVGVTGSVPDPAHQGAGLPGQGLF